MLGSDWLLSYEAERSFDLRLKKRNRQDYEIFGDLIDGGVEFYNKDAIPSVFEGVTDFGKIVRALEDRGGLYDDDDEDDDEDENEEEMLF